MRGRRGNVRERDEERVRKEGRGGGCPLLFPFVSLTSPLRIINGYSLSLNPPFPPIPFQELFFFAFIIMYYYFLLHYHFFYPRLLPTPAPAPTTHTRDTRLLVTTRDI